MSETEKKTPRKSRAKATSDYVESQTGLDAAAQENLGGLADEDGKPVLVASSLVAYNEVARNSRSVRAVQDELIERGHWDVRADDAGYWGTFTQDAAKAETDETDPIKAAEALGFVVLP